MKTKNYDVCFTAFVKGEIDIDKWKRDSNKAVYYYTEDTIDEFAVISDEYIIHWFELADEEKSKLIKQFPRLATVDNDFLDDLLMEQKEQM